jgi:hypothetical protein
VGWDRATWPGGSPRGSRNRELVDQLGHWNNLLISVGDKSSIAYYGLTLGSFDMALGVQWLESLVPILWDFGQRAMDFVQDEHRVLWCATDVGDPQPCLHVMTTDMMAELLLDFEPVFA